MSLSLCVCVVVVVVVIIHEFHGICSLLIEPVRNFTE